MKFSTKIASESVFFFRVYSAQPPQKSDSWEISEISSASNFVLRPFQKKNPRGKTKISARCARRQQTGRGKNTRKSFLILVSSDQKPQNDVFGLFCVFFRANAGKSAKRGPRNDTFVASNPSQIVHLHEKKNTDQEMSMSPLWLFPPCFWHHGASVTVSEQ